MKTGGEEDEWKPRQEIKKRGYELRSVSLSFWETTLSQLGIILEGKRRDQNGEKGKEGRWGVKRKS